MGTEDARESGPVVERLVGRECERTLAINTIKLRFGTEQDRRGDSYLWIDPPWRLRSEEVVITTSDDYDEVNFQKWSHLFNPLNRVRFIGWEAGETETTFYFQNGFRIIVPDGDDVREDNNWYAHWYARDFRSGILSD